jgi:tetratricopeptide (TPR) repeat protein
MSVAEKSFACSIQNNRDAALRSFDVVMIRVAFLLSVTLCFAGCNQSNSPSGGGDRPSNVATESTLDDPVVAIRRAILRRQYDQARQRITGHLVRSPDDLVVLELAGDLYAELGDYDQSIGFYVRLVELQEKPNLPLLDKLGQQWMSKGRPFESLSVLSKAITFYPEDASVRQRLVGLQASLGLEEQAYEHLQWLVQHQQGQLNYLMILSDLTRPQTVAATCHYALEQKTGDLRPHYSLARIPAYHGRWQEVMDELRPLIEANPSFIQGSALWGRSLVELDRHDELQQWVAQLPKGIEQCVDYWMAMGIHAEKRDKLEQAAGAFQRVLLMNANHPEALNRLSLLLGRIGQKKEAERVAARAAEVGRLRTHVDSLISWKTNSQESAVQIGKSLERLGRQWEATAWLAVAYTMTQNLDSGTASTFQAMRSRLSATTPWQDPSKLVASKSSLLSIDEFNWSSKSLETALQAGSSRSINLQFTDESRKRGVDHLCKVTAQAGKESGLAIYQSGAGAAGILDFDLDGWPDLYLTSMDGRPNQEDSSSNRLFRNHSGSFIEQTLGTQLEDRGFSQGVAVGDYDADGFPDLLVASVGANHLYRNNGDGTFANVSETVGLAGSHWTTSVVLADIDGDGNCDLFELGYCAGEDALVRQCMESEINEPRSCSPLAFPAQGDLVWRSDGRGRLVNVTQQWLGDHEPGRGMGVVVGQFDSRPGLDLYVSNDMTANHLWLSNQQHGMFTLSEQATIRGLALNQRSLAQASMGIAVGDPDQDSDVDFFVTHFSADHNTYYEQVDEGLWADRSDVSGLAEPSQRLLAYGTQWIDGNNDGVLELFVANGDIDDFTHQGRSYRQPFQVYRREVSGRWQLIDSNTMGDYFKSSHLARAVAGVDFDRDRQTDVVVTHLFEPVALLRNQTSQTGNSVRLVLKGTASHRDAIGSVVTFRSAAVDRSQQLFAGDGYHCSSERVITIGTGSDTKLSDVVVTWPDGVQESFGELPVGLDYLLVQGSGEVFQLDAQ